MSYRYPTISYHPLSMLALQAEKIRQEKSGVLPTEHGKKYEERRPRELKLIEEEREQDACMMLRNVGKQLRQHADEGAKGNNPAESAVESQPPKKGEVKSTSRNSEGHKKST